MITSCTLEDVWCYGFITFVVFTFNIHLFRLNPYKNEWIQSQDYTHKWFIFALGEWVVKIYWVNNYNIWRILCSPTSFNTTSSMTEGFINKVLYWMNYHFLHTRAHHHNSLSYFDNPWVHRMMNYVVQGQFSTIHVPDQVSLLLSFLMQPLKKTWFLIKFYHFVLSLTWLFTIQPYGEIDPKFVLEHYNELGDEWILRDDNDNPYLVTVVKNEMKPIITNGWVSFREAFTIEGTRAACILFGE